MDMGIVIYVPPVSTKSVSTIKKSASTFRKPEEILQEEILQVHKSFQLPDTFEIAISCILSELTINSEMNRQVCDRLRNGCKSVSLFRGLSHQQYIQYELINTHHNYPVLYFYNMGLIKDIIQRYNGTYKSYRIHQGSLMNMYLNVQIECDSILISVDECQNKNEGIVITPTLLQYFCYC